MKTIAALTTCRNDTIFAQKWVEYYGKELGRRALFLILDGYDQSPPADCEGVNIIHLPHQPKERVPAMRRRARVMSDFARGLHRYFDCVMAMDIDEFLVVDPKLNMGLAEYLSAIENKRTVSGLGLDVGQKLGEEGPIDLSRPFLSQRHYAHISARYTKPSASFAPITWGSGMHRIKYRGFSIDPNLYHFHFGMVDYELATGKTADQDRLNTGWGEHLSRREELFKIIAENPAYSEDYLETARLIQSWRRPFYAWNKPDMIPGNPVLRIPKRFREVV